MKVGLNFSRSGELERWLSDKPAEWAQIIAWRAAMRAVPALGRLAASSMDDGAKSGLTLTMYRALLISLVARNWPTEDIKAAAAAAAAAAATAAHAAAAAAARAAAAAAAARAAAAAAARAAAAYAVRAAAAYAARAAAAAADAAAYAVWSAVTADADFLNAGKSPGELARTPLWTEGQPEELTELWRAHKGSNPDFAPWFAWYEAAARGESFSYFSEKLSREIAPKLNEWWDRGADAVNADISEMLKQQPKAVVDNWEINPSDILPHFSTDDNTRLNDRLGVANDARIFARLLAATDTSLPLAVGLFGPWGGGKSFFMKLMRREMAGLKGRKGFHGEIAHIEFNAWHYVDADLWASLGLRIFEGVAEHLGGERESAVAKERRDLADAVDSNKQIKADAESALEAAEKQLKTLSAALTTQEAARLGELDAALLAKLTAQIDWAANVKKISVALKIAEPSQIKDIEQMFLTARSAGAAVEKLLPPPLDRLPSSRKKVAGLVAAAVLAAVVAAAPGVRAFFGDLFSNVTSLASAAVAFAAGWSSWLAPKLAEAKNAAEIANRLKSRYDAARAAVVPNAAAEGEIAVLKSKIAATEREIAAAQARLLEIDSGMLLYDHLTQRAKDGRYVDRQGVVAVLRRDLEHLKDYLGALNHDTAKISRIVLYIDDLDRCEPGRVVEVLQAVHLLLAFPLFAVVVAVDPRWLERSLYDKYLPDHRKLTDEQLAEEDFSPRNYLEKIFQIPFRLDPKLNGFKAMVDGLTAGMVETPAKPVATGRNETSPTAAEQRAVNTGKTEGTPKAAVSPDVSGPALVWAPPPPDKLPPPARLSLTPAEVEALKQVHPFIPTPRALKRMLNVYLLVRLRNEAAAQDPIAVMTLLGLEIGFPAAGRELLRAIRDQRDHEDWPLLILAKDKLKASPERARLIEALTQAAPDVTVERARPWLAAAFRFSFDPPEDPGPTPAPIPAPAPAEIPMT